MSNQDSKEDYSELRYDNLTERSFVIFGDREKYEAAVRDIGGKWNPRVKPAGGWVLNKTKKRAIDSLIRDLKADPTADPPADDPTDILSQSQKGIPLQSKSPVDSKSHLDSTYIKKKYKTKKEKLKEYENSQTDSGKSAANSDKKQEFTQNSENSHTDSGKTAVNSDKKQEFTQDPEKTEEDPEKTDEESEKTEEDPEKTDEESSDPDEDPEKTDEESSDPDEESEDPDEDPEKTDEEEDDTLSIEKQDLEFDKRIGNPEEKLLVQRRNKFITDYVNSDDEIDAEESKIMLNRFKNYFTYYKTYARSPEKFDNTKTKEARKKYTL